MSYENIKPYLKFNSEVYNALNDKKPVVSLESTILSHGMEYPQNIETAIEIEELIRKNNAIPATIAIINGKICIGISKDELNFLCTSKNIIKTSIRDIPVIIANKSNGATTVSATMFISQLAGIKVFVTGGIGGVHRNAQNTLDISSDLTTLGGVSVAVICAGAKSILDIGLTLEKLETLGVPVIGYKTDEFPSFYSRKSGFKLNYNAKTPAEIAAILKTKWDIGLNGGVVIGNPIPNENEIPYEEINPYIEEALLQAKNEKIKGKDITPYLLKKLFNITSGKSLKANIALVKNNAILGGKIASKFSELENEVNNG